MDGSRYRVRDHADTDFEAESRLFSTVEPESPVTAGELRHYRRLFDPPAEPRSGPSLYLCDRVVEEQRTGDVVAAGQLSHAPEAFDPDRYWLEVVVAPAHRGQGIGRELYRGFEELATSRRARTLMASARAEDPRGVRFLGVNGFVERHRFVHLRLDLARSAPTTPRRDPASWEREGVTFVTLADEGPEDTTVRDRLYSLSAEAELDVPRLGVATSFSYAQFVEIVFGRPGYSPDAIFLARDGDRYVAMTSLVHMPYQSDTLHVGFTGTARTHRGRGLATELKLRAVDYARANGFRYLATGNDAANRPIRAINERLGFRTEFTRILGEKELRPGT